MANRRDPLPAAAELVLQVEQTARFQPGGNAVATVGIFEVHPGASNSIPSRVQMSIDVRDVELWVRDQMVEKLRQSAAQIAEHRGIAHEFHIINADPALRCDTRIVGAAVAAAQQWQLPYKTLVSRAYHDTVFMGRICPVGMIFVPSRGGYSHRPEEYTAPTEIGNGVQVETQNLASLRLLRLYLLRISTLATVTSSKNASSTIAPLPGVVSTVSVLSALRVKGLVTMSRL